MELEFWEGGLQAQEIRAINRIKTTFADSKLTNKKIKRGGSLQDQLRSIGDSSMFPWKGYAGFRFVDSARGYEGEFDLVIVTHCNVIIVELKDWNHGEITYHKDKWYKNNQLMSRSPVSVTRNKKFLLENKLKREKHKFTNKFFLPQVHFFVVMSGNADFSRLPNTELHHTISLDEFLTYADQKIFDRKFNPHSGSKVLNQDFHIFDSLFLGGATAPKQVSVNGYKAESLIFDGHPTKLYKEFLAKSELSTQDEALLRIWNFNNFDGVKGGTSEGRYTIVSREREVLSYIKHQNLDLYKHCLRSLTNVQPDDVTTEFNEIFELPPNHRRFNEFIGKFGNNFSDIDRLNLVKLLVAKFADLHKIKVAHRDLGDHSLWISPGKEIALSNFISAYHQPIGTVGSYRSQLSISDVNVDDALSPFQSDVKALGVLCWHILVNERISKMSLENLGGNLISCNEWYKVILHKAINEGAYQNAISLFDALKEAEPSDASTFDFDDSELEPYRANISHTRQYREDDEFIVENDEKEVYVSDGLMVKAWLNVNPSSDKPALSYKVLYFLQRLEKIRSINPPYLPCVREFGIATKSSSLFVVTDKVEGFTWDKLLIGSEECLPVIEKLIKSIEHLHGLGLYHGDLHPENIILSKTVDGLNLTLIDTPDFCIDDDEPKNHLYSPENIDNCTAFERDNFAVMRLAFELLGGEWGVYLNDYPDISDAIKIELSDLRAGFKDLERFKTALKPKEITSIQPITISSNKDFENIIIYPDNGKLYVHVEKSRQNVTDVMVKFYGLGGNVGVIYSTNEKGFIVCLAPYTFDSIHLRDIEKCQLVLDFPIQIKSGAVMELSQLTQKLKDNEPFNRTVEAILKPAKEEQEIDGITSQLDELFKNIEAKSISTDHLAISTQKLWKAVLETETQAYPYIEVIGGANEVSDSDDQLILPYASDVDVLGQFNKSDVIEALKIVGEEENRLGEVNLKQSALNEIRLHRINFRARHLEDGDQVFFRTKQDKASYVKRKAALERILDHESVVSKLAQYFDPDCLSEAIQYDNQVTEEDFTRYDRTDDHNNKISLNQKQRTAFQRLLNNGPLSLLQGPPGTGKTEFIAAFVHHLIEKQNVKNILLVSQSHEAVNTAAERIRKHCSRLNTELNVVRFSNREGAVSTGLKDVYSNAIVAEKRELFRAEAKYRVASLSQALGLQADFLSELVETKLTLFKQIDTLHNSVESMKNGDLEKDELQIIKKSVIELDATIREALSSNYNINYDEEQDIRNAKSEITKYLCNRYSVRPDEAEKAIALANISGDMLNVLETERVNYDEFFARSRQLVTGTCVGIGQRHLGIADNQYDWVIIDEAARSIASELAIAMQSGKRVLLVGDHKQLPPLYSDAHKKALALKLGLADKEIDLDAVLQSDFARAFESPYGKQTGASLLTQYRMAPPIGNIVSDTFYEGELENGERKIPDIYGNAPEMLQSVVSWIDTSHLGDKSYHRSDRGVSIYNRTEADIIINLLKDIASKPEFVAELKGIVKKDEAAVGVICMYGEQKRIIRQKFKEIEWSDDFKELVKIDTVDSYQGKENRIIILSVTRSSGDKKPKFLRTPNRINVAISRAMDRLMIVGSTHMWQGHNSTLPLGKVLSYIEAQTKKSDDYSIHKINRNLNGVKND
ncbi:AAA domain-containing protein [Proteus faecis]|uniref:AAA domain-containing protein n=1 Tax=Proteus faecis TaxID=2050967 RepID=UPI000D68B68C|nr:AAA domain-containing protein [Proteus faecis]